MKINEQTRICLITNAPPSNSRFQFLFSSVLAVRLWEVSVVNRLSLIEPFVWLTSKMTQPPSKSSHDSYFVNFYLVRLSINSVSLCLRRMRKQMYSKI